jgi:hypothetical protein
MKGLLRTTPLATSTRKEARMSRDHYTKTDLRIVLHRFCISHITALSIPFSCVEAPGDAFSLRASTRLDPLRTKFSRSNCLMRAGIKPPVISGDSDRYHQWMCCWNQSAIADTGEEMPPDAARHQCDPPVLRTRDTRPDKQMLETASLLS